MLDHFTFPYTIRNMEISDRIKQLRKDRKMSLIELSHKMGIALTRLCAIENGTIIPTAEEVETIEAFIEGRL